ncbi:malic enzyme domain protein, partial [Cooperia oncophora]
MDELQRRTEKLFYRVLCENVKELMPISVWPAKKFGFIYRASKDTVVFMSKIYPTYAQGLYITINDNSISKIYQILCNWPIQDVQAIQWVLDVGKLGLYVALGGVQPQWCLPVVLDVGTNNQSWPQSWVLKDAKGDGEGETLLTQASGKLKKLLDDPFYIGLRRKRVRGPEYDRLIDNFMKAVTKRFGRDTLVQFEDFAFANAFTLLDRYKNDYCTFNDDIQGTAAVIVAGLLAATRVTKTKLSQQKIVFLGAGSAGLGIAELCVMQMMDEGLTEEQAREKIFLLNSKGLITKDRAKTLTPRHQLYG